MRRVAQLNENRHFLFFMVNSHILFFSCYDSPSVVFSLDCIMTNMEATSTDWQAALLEKAGGGKIH